MEFQNSESHKRSLYNRWEKKSFFFLIDNELLKCVVTGDCAEK